MWKPEQRVQLRNHDDNTWLLSEATKYVLSDWKLIQAFFFKSHFKLMPPTKSLGGKDLTQSLALTELTSKKAP